MMTIDLTSYSTTTQMNTAITTALAAYTDTTNLTSLLANKISTSHEANNIGNANVAFGAFGINKRTVTLQNSSGVTAVLSVDNGGNLNKGADGVITAPILNAREILTQSWKDSNGTVRSLLPSLGTLTYNGSTLIDLTYSQYLSSNYMTTTGLTSLSA